MPAANVPPAYEADAYDCPHCHVYSHQDWYQAWSAAEGYSPISDLLIAQCRHCGKMTIWYQQALVYPSSTTAPSPNPDLPPSVRTDYEEAADVLARSPRSAAALLRLALQKLNAELGMPGKSINDDIGALVKAGLPVRVQQALDSVRVIGNNAVHPGQLDVNDNPEIAVALFGLVNLIADNQISEPKHVQAVYDALPAGAKAAIDARDKS